MLLDQAGMGPGRDLYRCQYRRTGRVRSGNAQVLCGLHQGNCKIDCPASTNSPGCGGVLSNTVGETLFGTAAECCAAKFGWINKDLCVAMVTGAYTNKFYVDYASNSCKQDCAVGTNNCGGNPGDKSMQLFDTAASCCSSKLSYVNQAACTSKSTSGTAAAAAAATGSNKWYVDWSISKCAKDCATGSDRECGGLAETWEQATFGSWQVCCDTKLGWVKDSDCHLG